MPLYLCRLACDPGKDRCPGGEICCPGKIEGKTYGKTGGCVPESRVRQPRRPRRRLRRAARRPGQHAGRGRRRPAPADTAGRPRDAADTGEADAGADAPAEAGV